MLFILRNLVLALAAAGPAHTETLPHLFLSSGGAPSSSYRPSSSSSYLSSSSSSSYRTSSTSSHHHHHHHHHHPDSSSSSYRTSSTSSHHHHPSSSSSSRSSASSSHHHSSYRSSSPHPSSSLSLPQPVPLVMKKAWFVVVSEGQYDHAHHTHGRGGEDHDPREPHFATSNTSTQVFLGNTVTLDCTVHDMLNESVSWMRRVDDMLELITWDSHTYAKDDRYSLVRESGDRWHRWQLVIRRTRAEDRGQYRCQVATQPPMVLVVTLNVTEPVARVVDERGTKVVEKHYNSGSMIELKCIIEKVPFPHGPVSWRRGPTTLTYNTSRGGISVKGDARAGYIRSRLYVANAAPSDSGVYSCWYSNYTSDTVTVHVIAGENSQAMQHDGLPGSSSSTSRSGPPVHHRRRTSMSHLSLLSTTCLAALALTFHSTRLDLLLFSPLLLLLLLVYAWVTFFCQSTAVVVTMFMWCALLAAVSGQGIRRRLQATTWSAPSS